MLAAWWLAVVGLPVFIQPLAELPDEPAALAIAAGRASLRLPCMTVVCPDAEWTVDAARTADNGNWSWPPLETTARANPLASRRFIGLRSPAFQRDWVTRRGSNNLVDAGYGMQAISTPDTSVRVEMATGYRLQPYADNGTAAVGPVARGKLQLSQSLGPRTTLKQEVNVETGRRNTLVRQAIGLDFGLDPNWTLRSALEMRHDTAADGGKGATDTQSSLKMFYAF